jgi:hypothetical protein
MREIVTGDNYVNGDGTRKGNWMQTYSGRQFWPLDPRPEEVFINDIAHGLANACRYAGHCLQFYSVAEHSVLLSYIVPQSMALTGLLHDATEAYVVDVPRPIKPFLPGYKDIEAGVWRAIAARFGCPEELPDEIKVADNAMLLAEQAKIMAPPPAPWNVPGVAAETPIHCWQPDVAERMFLYRFMELTNG